MPEHSRSPLVELTLARTREFIRQPEAVFWVFAFPLLLALALGFAFREKAPDRTPIGILTGSGSDQLMKAVSGSPALLARAYSAAEGADALRTGKISLLVEPGPQIVYRFDPTRPDARIARLEADEAIQTAAGRKSVRPTSEKHVTEKGSRYIDFLVPGLLGMNLMGTGMWGVGFSIVTARSQKLLKRLIATPMRRSHYMIAQMLARLLFLVLEVVTLVAFGWLVFDVSVHGSLIVLGIVCLVGAAAFAGLGLLVASRVQTIEGVSGLMNFVMMPMWLLSGVFFSSARFPDYAQPFIKALPLTALNDALRGVMTEGRSLAAIGPELLILTAWGVVCFVIALRIFQWK
ncbi:MAG TPA: ABC transporter permease [Thermoanaerobaculia bacterium]|nr:ABC transporter permease [Thermoanaerobaculia bacterium]